MNGTRICVTSPIRLMPPTITAAVRMARSMPEREAAMPKGRRLSANELACTMFPMPNAATDVSSAKSAPSQGIPSPLRSVYIAPPRNVPEASGSR